MIHTKANKQRFCFSESLRLFSRQYEPYANQPNCLNGNEGFWYIPTYDWLNRLYIFSLRSLMHTCIIRPPVQNKSVCVRFNTRSSSRATLQFIQGCFAMLCSCLAQWQQQLHPPTPTVLNDKSSHQHTALSIRAVIAHEKEAILKISLKTVTSRSLHILLGSYCMTES